MPRELLLNSIPVNTKVQVIVYKRHYMPSGDILGPSRQFHDALNGRIVDPSGRICVLICLFRGVLGGETNIASRLE